MKVGCVRRVLSALFGKLGKTVGRHPYYFILIPFLLSVALSILIVRLTTIENFYNIVTSDKGKIFETRKVLEEMFSYNSAQFSDQIRFPNLPTCLVVYMIEKNERNMFEKNVLSEVILVDEIIQNVTIQNDAKTIRYSDLCSLNNNKCFRNPFVEAISEEGLEAVLQRKKKLKYPVDIDLLSFTFKAYFINLGGVTLDHQNYVDTAKAAMLMYTTDENDEEKRILFEKWTFSVYDILQNYEFSYIKVFPSSDLFLNNEFSKEFGKTIPKIAALIVFMTVYSMLAYLSQNWVRSKPLIGAASVISAGLAVVSAFGLMAAFGIKNTSWNATIPYLVLVTEIDDAFVMIGCWRITSPKYKVVKRMEMTYSEAGISITITSLTNFVSYCIGMMTPFPFVRIFCFYSATCIMFTFLYQITFFGGCLALSGYKEAKDQIISGFELQEQSEEIEEENNKMQEEASMVEKDTLRELWEIAEEFEFPILVHCIKSSIIEQGVIIGKTVYQLFWITSLSITAIFLLVVPNVLSAIIIAISVVSSIIETFGFMSFWAVNLDMFSMMSLILCVGFSVNYPAHMTYAYSTSAKKTAHGKMKDSLYRIGFAIFQGSLSTGVGILFLYSNIYFISTFVKIVVLIAIETAFHALFFIPVVLSSIFMIFKRK